VLRFAARVVVLAQALIAIPAHAQVAARIEVRGACPSAAAMRRALASTITLPDARDARSWVVQVAAEPTASGSAARLALIAPDGTTSLERHIESADCEALADAFALVVYAHFLDLRVLPPDTPPPPAASRPPEQAPRQPPRAGAARPRRQADRGTALAAPDRAAGAGAGTTPPSRATVAVAGGAELGVDPVLLAAIGAVAIEVAPGVWPIAVRARGVLSGATDQSEAASGDRIELSRIGVTLELSRRLALGPAVWIEPRAGGGAIVTRVTALDVEGQPSLTRVHPAVTLATTLAIRLAGPLWLGAELHAAVLPLGDRYVIDPIGEVGRSPLLLASALGSIGADLFF